METDPHLPAALPVAESPPAAEPLPRSPSRLPEARSAPEFPGCRQVHISREDIGTYDGRFEYWEAETETAWMVREPTGLAHEGPSQRLAGLCSMICAVRGAPIECYGTMDLELRNRYGERGRIMQADQSVYLHPSRARLPSGGGMIVGVHDLPDVVLEVDHTTDVRQGKLGLYEAWGFPEVWVEVPERYSPSRARGRRPGLTIHRLADGRYRESAQSGAFAGWRAEEIHAAMNEAELSEATSRVLHRVGRILGVRDGTGPDDMPWLRMQRRETFAEGHAEGRVEGRTEGREEGRAKTVRQILLSRGFEVSPGFPADVPGFAESPEDVVVAAALACAGERDFCERIG